MPVQGGNNNYNGPLYFQSDYSSTNYSQSDYTDLLLLSGSSGISPTTVLCTLNPDFSVVNTVYRAYNLSPLILPIFSLSSSPYELYSVTNTINPDFVLTDIIRRNSSYAITFLPDFAITNATARNCIVNTNFNPNFTTTPQIYSQTFVSPVINPNFTINNDSLIFQHVASPYLLHASLLPEFMVSLTIVRQSTISNPVMTADFAVTDAVYRAYVRNVSINPDFSTSLSTRSVFSVTVLMQPDFVMVANIPSGKHHKKTFIQIDKSYVHRLQLPYNLTFYVTTG